MRKRIFFATLMVCLFVFASCGENAGGSDGETQENQSSIVPTSIPLPTEELTSRDDSEIENDSPQLSESISTDTRIPITYELRGDTILFSGRDVLSEKDIYRAFKELLTESTFENVKKIVIGEGITEIGEGTFSWMYFLTDVKISNSVTIIGHRAFEYCENLMSIIIPDSVIEIGEWAFAGCENLTNITIPNSVAIIGRSAFVNTPWMENIRNQENPFVMAGSVLIDIKGEDLAEEVIIPKGVTGIGPGVFSHTNIRKVVIPESVIRIGDGAFQSMGLEDVVIPDSVTSIGSYAFSNTFWKMEKLFENDFLIVNNILLGVSSEKVYGEVLEIPSEVVSIACELKTPEKVILPKGLQSIQCWVFGKEANIVIPDSVKSISSNAFMECPGMVSIEIPNSVKSIGSGAFSYCVGLESIVIPGNVKRIAMDTFIGCTRLKTVEILDGVTSIDSNAFFNCTALEKIIIPDSVTYISELAFSTPYGNGILEGITIYCSVGSYAETFAKENNISYVTQ